MAAAAAAAGAGTLPAAAFEHIELSMQPGGVAVLRLARPEAMNALHMPMVREIRRALETVAGDSTARVLVLAAKGRGFCAGADLSGFPSKKEKENGKEKEKKRETPTVGGENAAKSAGDLVAEGMEAEWNPMIAGIRNFPLPTIAVVNGAAAGGGVGVALATDVTIAARSAYFVLTFTPTLGICPDLGVTWQLNRRLGRGWALPLALLGPRLYAEEAQRRQLIWEACDDNALWPRALELAARLAVVPPQAARLVRGAVDASTSSSLEVQLRTEMEAQRRLFEDPESSALSKATSQRFVEAAARRRAKL